jgi:hypothetical protein
MSISDVQVMKHESEAVGQVSIYKAQSGKTLWSVKVPADGEDHTRPRMEEALETALAIVDELIEKYG